MTVVKLNIDGVDFTVTPISPTGLLLVPVGVTAVVDELDALGWTGEQDAATDGTSVGATTYPVTIGGRTGARLFTNTYTNYGGFRYDVDYDTDATSTHFVYAGDLYFESVAGLAQIELDNNQVTSDGKTYIFGVQCNLNDGLWDITKTDTTCHWLPTAAVGNPKNFPLNTWLHFEIASHRDNAGNVTYDAVYFNGATQEINTTLPSAISLGWSIGACVVNLQIGGDGASGSVEVYANNLKVAKW
jgi:hypothetical protein